MQHLLWQALLRPTDPETIAGKWRPRNPRDAAWRMEWHRLQAEATRNVEQPASGHPVRAARRVRLAWPF